VSISRLIVGLGNPGKEYIYTRHNLGFLVVQDLAKRYKILFSKNSVLKSFTGEGTIEGIDVRFFLPLTYMNNSGAAVKAALQRGDQPPSELLIVTDDFHLEFGELRIRATGSAGGHNGLKSIIDHIETNEFARLRLGIGSPTTKEEDVDFVLSEFSSQEKKQLAAFIEEAVQCCVTWLTTGTQAAMNQYNKRKKNE